jgi:hypothetical protein
LAVIFHIYYRAAGDFARRGSIEKPAARRWRHKGAFVGARHAVSLRCTRHP